jgi:hypothetical protein
MKDIFALRRTTAVWSFNPVGHALLHCLLFPGPPLLDAPICTRTRKKVLLHYRRSNLLSENDSELDRFM